MSNIMHLPLLEVNSEESKAQESLITSMLQNRGRENDYRMGVVFMINTSPIQVSYKLLQQNSI